MSELVPGSRLGIPASVRRELRGPDGGSGPGVRLGASLAARLPTVPNSGTGDDAIVALAVRRRAVVLTADRGLQARLLDAGRDVLVPRDRTRLRLVRGKARRGRAATVKSPSPVDRRPSRRARR